MYKVILATHAIVSGKLYKSNSFSFSTSDFSKYSCRHVNCKGLLTFFIKGKRQTKRKDTDQNHLDILGEYILNFGSGKKHKTFSVLDELNETNH